MVSRGLEAALLLIPRVSFLPWKDPRIRGTVDAIGSELSSNGFVQRYDPTADGGVDGLPGTEGAFLACSFWMADALHGTGRTGQAHAMFKRLLGLPTTFGLLSEQYDPANTARQLTGSHTYTPTSASKEQQDLSRAS